MKLISLAELANYKRSGVYCIMNTVDGKKYVGSSVNINNRVKNHFLHLRKGNHSNDYLQKAFTKHGEPAFVAAICQECHRTELLSAEREWMNTLQCCNRDFGYNIQIDPINPGNISPETRAKISAALRGQGNHWHKANNHPMSKEHRKRISDSLMGNKRRQGIPHSDEIKKKISEAGLGRTYVMSDEHKAKLSIARQGAKASESTKKIMSNAQRRRYSGERGAQERAKTAAKSKGRVWSDEQKAKLSLTKQLWWKDRKAQNLKEDQ